jgi:hypothetical protein
MTGSCPFTDPQRLFQDLAATRGEGGLPYSETFQARVVSHYDDIVEALHDPADLLVGTHRARHARAVAGAVRRPGAVPRHAARPGQPGS